MKTYKDAFLNSLLTVFKSNPGDLNFKKYFGLELYKKGELEDAQMLLREVYDKDKDLNVEKALEDIRNHITPVGEIDQSLVEISQVKKANKITFADVSGMDQVKEAIRTDIIYPYQHPELYKKYNKKTGGGILLYGPPGCGKTYIAKATAGEIDAQFYSIYIHEVISKYAGEGEKIVHETFEMGRENKPAVLFIDEIDALGMSREKTSGVLRTLVNQFLIELDGIESDNDGVLIIGATNLPWEVDTALRRPGRFDKIIFVPPPDLKARYSMFEISMKDKPHEELNYEILSRLTKKFSSADIARICDEASERTFRDAVKKGKEVPITQELIVEIIGGSKSSVSDWFSTVNNYIKYSNDSGFYNTVKEYQEKDE